MAPPDELPTLVTPIPGARSTALCERLAEVECPALTMRRARRAERSGASHDPIVWARTEGATVTDVDGNRFIDLTAGFGAALIGFGHPTVRAALHAQVDAMMHALGDVHPSEAKIALEQRLAAMAPWPRARVILGLSGSDGVEAALKSAMLATGRPGVIAFQGGYHGLSHGPLAACGYSDAFRAPFETQLNPHVRFAPYPVRGAPTLDVVTPWLRDGTVGAVLIEPILGRGGIVAPDEASMADLCATARAHGAIVIVDEIYTGVRRASNRMLFSSGWRELPDVVVLGKALGGTMPISACLMREEVAHAWGTPDREAMHTSTFLGNPLACVAALATLDVVESEAFSRTRTEAATHWWSRALAPLRDDPCAGVVALDGADLLIGVHLAGGMPRALAVMRALLERGYIVLPGSGGATGGGLALTPSAAMSPRQIDAFAAALRGALVAVPW